MRRGRNVALGLKLPPARAQTSAQNIIVMTRSMRPGLAGTDNERLYFERTSMLLGDAKKSVKKPVSEGKEAA